MTKKNRKPNKKTMVKNYVNLCQQAKQLWLEADAILDVLLSQSQVNDEIKLGKEIYRVVDNFSERNIAFKAASFKRFDLKLLKRKRLRNAY